MPSDRDLCSPRGAIDQELLAGTKDDEEGVVEMETIRMIRDLHWYMKSYTLMQNGESPKQVLDEIAQAGQDASNYSEINAWTAEDKTPCLNRLLTMWFQLTDDEEDDKRIHHAIALSGDEPKNFMDSLAIKVTNPSWLKSRKWQWKQWLRVKVKHAELLPGLDLKNLPSMGDLLQSLDSTKKVPEVLTMMLPTSKEAKEVPEAARRFARAEAHRKFMGFFINTTHKVEYEVYWCGVEGLFAVEGQESSTRYMMILGQLCRAPPNVFQTIMGQAIVRHHWALIFNWGFCVDRVIDVSALLFFASMASSAHKQKLPVWTQIYGSLCCSVISMLTNLCAHIQCFNLYKTLKPVMTFWNIVFAGLDLLTVIVLATLAQSSYNITDWHWYRTDKQRTDDFVNSVFDLHPVIFAMLVAGKWFKMMLALLNLEFIGTAILPVWEAARSRASLVFLFYLFMGTVACAHSYYTFAIDDIPDMLMAFFRMVRLTFLGDFDMMEIMGVDQHMTLANVSALYEAASLNNTAYSDATVGGIDDDDQPMFKYGIRAWVMMWAFIGPVMFMNTYIGLLGKAYEEAMGNIEALFAQFRISTLMMCLLRRHFWQRPVRNVCRCLGVCGGGDPASGHMERSFRERNPDCEFKGYWIIAPANLVEIQDDADDVSNKLDAFSKQMRDENAALKAELSKQMSDGDKALKDELSELKKMLKKALEQRT